MVARMPKTYRCERLLATITRAQCDRNRYGVPGHPGRPAVPPCFVCDGCPGLGDPVEIVMSEPMMSDVVRRDGRYYGTCPGCGRPGMKLNTKNGECKRCWDRRRAGRDVVTNEKLPITDKQPRRDASDQQRPVDVADAVAVSEEMAAVLDAAAESAESAESRDPRDTSECPHCGCALSSVEVEGLECPSCGQRLHTHLAQDGTVFTLAEPVGHSFGKVTNGVGELVPFGTDPVVIEALDEAWKVKRAEWLTDLSGVSPIKTLSRALQMVEALQGLEY